MKTFLLFLLLTIASTNSFSNTKTISLSGNWNNANIWIPTGVPQPTDEIIIPQGKTITIDSTIALCKSINIEQNGKVVITQYGTLSIFTTAGLNISGILENNGAITIALANTQLIINSGGKVIWSPLNNTQSAAQLFSNCIEQLNAESTLQIKKWFNTSKGIGDYISGNIGNLIISGIWNWNMGVSLRNHPIKGKLSIINSYAILDSANTISAIEVSSIELQNSNSLLDVFKGEIGNKTLNSNSIVITGGQLNLISGTSTANVSLINNGNVIANNLGTLCGSYQNDANSKIEIIGNADFTRSQYYGIYQGAGNHELTIGGNLTLLKSGNNFSEFHGIYNGNGNITIKIAGDFNHQGYSDLILNDGITGVGNGNASILIDGHFRQSSGDFRGIFNLTTYNAGKCEFQCKDLTFSGGIFMLYYACSNVVIKNTIKVSNNLTINFTNTSDIFRCNGLSNLNGTISNAQLELQVNGDSKIEGNAQSEFLTNTAYGKEDIITLGTFKISGGIVKFNYSAHPLTWLQGGDFSISGGQLFTSLDAGTTNISFNSNFEQSAGAISFKNKTGNTNITIAGNFSQRGGICKLYDNTTQPLSNSITLKIAGNFLQEDGKLDFCNNYLSTGNTTIQLSGNEYSATGGEITSSAQGNYFGQLQFAKQGILHYRNNSLHQINRIKQTIKTNCKVNVDSGDYQISTGQIQNNDFFEIEAFAELNLNTGKFIIGGNGNNSGVSLNENATIKISSLLGTEALNFPQGIYANYSINKQSTIELNGQSSIVNKLTGQSSLNIGKLKINLASSTIAELKSDLTVESQLILSEGYLNLNKFTVTINNNSPTGIIRTNGHLINNEREGIVKWNDNLIATYEFPFGTSTGKYIPVILNCKSGTGKCIAVNTTSTNQENTPLPIGLQSNLYAAPKTVNEQIDRWWKIEATGIMADITLSYASEENSTEESKQTENFSVQYKTNSGWSNKTGNGNGVTNNTGQIIAKNITSATYFTIISNGIARSADLLLFEVRKEQRNCELKWNTLNEINCKEYVVERSTDNTNFETEGYVNAKGYTTQQNEYTFSDYNLQDGKYYYRLKIKSTSGTQFYSETRTIEIGENVRNSDILNVKSIFPNPFNNKFTITYHLSMPATSKFSIISTNGQTLFTSEKQDQEGENTFEYNDELHLPTGTYLINVISGTQTFTSKIYKNVY